MSKHKKLLGVIVIIICLLVLTVLAVNRNYNTEAQASQAPLQDLKKLDEIRSRENIKKQQELIVQETYLVEEKARVQSEKEAAIAEFDSQITVIENQLEGVRSAKMSFQ